MKIYWVRRVDHGPGGTDGGVPSHVLVSVDGPRLHDEREYVKREARSHLGGNPDHYIVEPLTNHNEPVILLLRCG